MCQIICEIVLEEIGALGVQSFGLSLTTMEEVFLRVEEAVDESAEARY